MDGLHEPAGPYRARKVVRPEPGKAIAGGLVPVRVDEDEGAVVARIVPEEGPGGVDRRGEVEAVLEDHVAVPGERRARRPRVHAVLVHRHPQARPVRGTPVRHDAARGGWVGGGGEGSRGTRSATGGATRRRRRPGSTAGAGAFGLEEGVAVEVAGAARSLTP